MTKNIDINNIPSEIKGSIDKNNQITSDSFSNPIIKVSSKNEINVYLIGHEDLITPIITIIILLFLIPYYKYFNNSKYFNIYNYLVFAIKEGDIYDKVYFVFFFIMYFVLLIFMFFMIFQSHKQSYIKNIIYISKSQYINENDIKILQNGVNINFSCIGSSVHHIDHPENPLYTSSIYTENLKMEDMKQYVIEVKNIKIDFTFTHWHPTKKWRRFRPYKLIIENTKN